MPFHNTIGSGVALPPKDNWTSNPWIIKTQRRTLNILFPRNHSSSIQTTADLKIKSHLYQTKSNGTFDCYRDAIKLIE